MNMWRLIRHIVDLVYLIWFLRKKKEIKITDNHMKYS